MHPRPVAVAVVVLITAAALALGQANRAGAATGDQPVVSTADRADGGVTLRYRSTGIDGRPIVEKAIVWLPEGAPSGHVVAYAHPTTGLGDVCAPSVQDRPYVPALEELLARGHVVVAPDYEGLGSRGTHPYLVGESEGRSVLDAIRAARNLSGARGRSVVLGWSQGGHAALFAARMAPKESKGVRLAGVVAVAPVLDIGRLLQQETELTATSGFVAMLAAGFHAAYDELDPADLVPDAESLVAVARQLCVQSVINQPVASAVAPPAAWERRLRENDASSQGVDIPVLIAHGERDTLLPADDAVVAYRRLCTRGTPIRLERYAEADHWSVLERKDDLVGWIDDRLDGRSLTGCSQRRVL